MLFTALIILCVIVGFLLILAMVVIGMYNQLVTLRNRYKNAFSQIDVQLKCRYDLIPNLVEVAKGYMKHERETLEAVIKARNAAYAAGQKAAQNPGDPQSMAALRAEGQLTVCSAGCSPFPSLSRPEGQPEHARPAGRIDRRPRTRSPSPGKPITTRLLVYNTQREVFPTVVIAGNVQLPAGQFVRDRAGRTTKCRRSPSGEKRRSPDEAFLWFGDVSRIGGGSGGAGPNCRQAT